MLNVCYEKTEVIKTWLSASVEIRKELLTFKDSNLIALVNCINTSLVLAANNTTKTSYEILESIDTYWTEPICMQIKPGLLKGQKLISMLQDKYPQFIQGKKTLYLDSNDYIKLLDSEFKTWEAFQFAMCKIIEQAFLTLYYQRLSKLADKAAKEILEPEAKKKKKKKKTKQIEEPWFDCEKFFVEIKSDISTDISTDIDDKELNEMLFFDINSLGGKSWAMRKYYANIALPWDNEVQEIINQSYYEMYPLEYWQNCPIVRYYYPPNYMHPN
ncbi:hypothetical protein SteCoe_12204 [Stentor coeruleus]|uniref:Uncharacterized protein n=1 Tax=Stentor coeruleus TaxID=5963 RepID=A0A1R2CBC8_9CILI|nr:hypothetical protein SteCoe_12204 [Stentor coeruleus]